MSKDAGNVRDAGGNTKKDASGGASRSDAGQSDPSADKPEVEACAGLEAEATARLLPVDIIWAIDGSGSMVPSFPAIQQALNQFSKDVEAAGVDAHIVLLTSSGLCVPAPLGSGSCGVGGGLGIGGGIGGGLGVQPPEAPDTNDPRLLHLDISFGYSEGMNVLLNNYPYYKQVLRADARTHLVLTEDGAPQMSAQAVIDHIEGRTGVNGSAAWKPGLAADSWVFSGVVCKDGIGGGACLTAAFRPDTTLQLIEMSGGVLADLSQAGAQGQDPFKALLDELATKVIVGAELSCDYDIPAVPVGETFDRSLVNVLYGPASADKQVLPRAQSDCGDALAWNYDNDDTPTKILLCPKACERVREQAETKVEVKFGCQTAVLL